MTKRVALQDSNITRYHQEFHELGLIGTGEFGSVYKCINRLDGCTYAIKKSIKPVAGSINEKNALNEVYAHAVLGKHQHVVRYYSAWAENNHMIIQNEYCNGGSLADVIARLQTQKMHMTEPELRQLLLHVVEGLRYIHSMQLVHMDIKPGNIFISKEKRLLAVNYDSADDGFDEEETVEEEITYKIGDLGHVTSINNPQVEEGDCRYLPTEILREDFTHLPKADVFALGLTVYEAGGGGPLPKNGPAWHEIRQGNLKELPLYSRDFNDLLKVRFSFAKLLFISCCSTCQASVLYPWLFADRFLFLRTNDEQRLNCKWLESTFKFDSLQSELSSTFLLNQSLEILIYFTTISCCYVHFDILVFRHGCPCLMASEAWNRMPNIHVVYAEIKRCISKTFVNFILI